MDIQQTSLTQPTPSLQSEDRTAADARASLTSDFETFLKMLTTQLENQDPLNPLDSADFAVQLATFSGVEQQVRTNDLLEKVLNGGGLGGLSEAARFVGKEVRAPVAAQYSGAPVALYAEFPAGTDQAVLIVTDSSGAERSRLAIDAAASELSWDGTDSGGAPLPPGTYSFRIDTASEGAPTGSITPEVFGLVTEARLENGDASLVFATGETLPAGSATAIRLPPSE